MGHSQLVMRNFRDDCAKLSPLGARYLRYPFDTHPHAMHFWLHLPEPWRREEFTQELAREGIRVAGAEAFAVGRGSVPHAVRVGITAVTRAELEAALSRMRDLLSGRPTIREALV